MEDVEYYTEYFRTKIEKGENFKAEESKRAIVGFKKALTLMNFLAENVRARPPRERYKFNGRKALSPDPEEYERDLGPRAREPEFWRSIAYHNLIQ